MKPVLMYFKTAILSLLQNCLVSEGFSRDGVSDQERTRLVPLYILLDQTDLGGDCFYIGGAK